MKVLVINRDEFQAQALASFYVTHHRVCTNLPLVRKEVELYGSVKVFLEGAFDEHSAQAKIPHSREVFPAVTAPESIDAFAYSSPRRAPAKIGRPLPFSFS